MSTSITPRKIFFHTFDDVLQAAYRLGLDPKPRGKGYRLRCPCPSHADEDPSCDLDRSDDNRALLVCRSRGCDQKSMFDGLGLKWSPQSNLPDQRPQPLPSKGINYWYLNAEGKEVLIVNRQDTAGGKKITQWKPLKAGGYTSGKIGNMIRPLYRLPEMNDHDADKVVLVVEGEKCCDATRRAFPSWAVVTWSQGANSVHKTDWSPLHKRKVLLVADADTEGREAMKQIATSLFEKGSKVKMYLPEGETNEDIADWLEHEGADAVLKRLKDAVEFQPQVHVTTGAIQTSRNKKALEAVLRNEGIEIRFNVRSDKLEYGKSGAWREADRHFKAEYRDLIEERYKYERSDGRVVPLAYGRDYFTDKLLATAFDKHVDPFILWLEGLPAWDTTARLGTYLNDLFGVRGTDLDKWVGQYLFLGAIQRAYEPGCRLKHMPILVGRQGTGKSPLLSEMLPAEYRQQWFGDGLNFTENAKTRVEDLQGKVMVEFAELAGIKRTDLASLKAYISRTHDDIRRAYREDPQGFPRRCIIVGTTDNTLNPLPNDETGLTRFVPIRLERGGNVEKYMAEHRVQLWAEALEKYRAGTRAALPRDLHDVQAMVAEEYRDADPIEEKIRQNVLERLIHDPLPLDEITKLIDHDPLDSLRQKQVGKALRNIGCHQIRRDNKRLWTFGLEDAI